MKVCFDFCDLCGNKMESKKDKNGFCIEVGYSIGGWGHRQDFVRKQSLEVCDNCFRVVRQKSMELNHVMKELRKKNDRATRTQQANAV